MVDYLGIAHELKQALVIYTESGGQGRTAIPQDEAIATMLEKYEICRGLFHGFNWSVWVNGTSADKLALLPNAQEHILRQADGKRCLAQAVTELSIAFALAVPHDEAMKIRDDVGFFQAVRNVLAKSADQQQRPDHELDAAIRQIVSRAVVTDGVVDIFSAAGLKKPDISVLSDEFLAEIGRLPQKNLAVELLRKLLNGEIRTRSRRNVVKSRLFSELLENSLRKYQNRAIQAAQVIEELIALARQMRTRPPNSASTRATTRRPPRSSGRRAAMRPTTSPRPPTPSAWTAIPNWSIPVTARLISSITGCSWPTLTTTAWWSIPSTPTIPYPRRAAATPPVMPLARRA